jgi:maleylacetate reductase
MSIVHADAGRSRHVSPSTAFAYGALPYRVLFGSGTIDRLGDEAERLGIKRALVLTTRQQREDGARLGERLRGRLAAVFSEARMHTPVDVTEAAIKVVEANDIDGLVAVGGGSTVGLGKALSLRTGLPQIAVPTTYAGSEMTPILGETRRGLKTTQRSRDLVPDTVIYDVDLTIGLPSAMSAASGMNAIAHAVEALYAPDANPVTSLMAEEGIAALGRALPHIVKDLADKSARQDAFTVPG